MKLEENNSTQRGDDMKFTSSVKGDFKNISKWLEAVDINNAKGPISRLSERGLRALSAATPQDTGETSQSWVCDVESSGQTIDIYYANGAHPESPVNVAKIIQLGHVNSGGYVPPRNYIRPAINSVFGTKGENMTKEIFK